MAVIEVDFRNKSEIEVDKTVNTQNLSQKELEFLYKFRQLNEIEQGEIKGEMNYFIARKIRP